MHSKEFSRSINKQNQNLPNSNTGIQKNSTYYGSNAHDYNILKKKTRAKNNFASYLKGSHVLSNKSCKNKYHFY